MLEELYYYDFKEELSEGTYIEDGSLINRKLTVNEDFFLNWDSTTNYGNIDIAEDNESITMRVNRPSQMERNLSGVYRDEIEVDESLDVDNLTEASTYLLSDSSVQDYTDYIEMLIDWKAVDLPKEDTGEIKISTDSGEYFILRLFNKSKIEFSFFDGSSEFTTQNVTTHPESTANISHLFRNDIKELKLIVKLTDDDSGGHDINVQIASKGIKSEWITRSFSSNKITKIDTYLPYDNDHTAKELKLYDIYIEGFYSDETYVSKTIELEGDENDIQNISLDGEVIDSLPFSDDVNTPLLKVDVADVESNLDLSSGKEFTLNEATGDFILSEEITESYGGKYLKFGITNSLSKEYQNAINYLLIDYEVIEETIYDFNEIQVSKTIGPSGGVIEIGDIFNSKLFIPEDALDTDTEITITMLGSDDDRIAPNSLAYDFQPSGLTFNEDLLFTLDYSNFEFDYYSNEEGLSVIYVQNYNTEDSQEIDSTIYKDKNKLISYIEHFSTYVVQPTDNLYTSRTKYHTQEFPSWMKLQDKESNFQQYQNYSLNTEMDKLYEDKTYAQQQLFINRADTEQRFISFIVDVEDFHTDAGEQLTKELTTDTFAEYKGKEYSIVFNQVEFFTRYDNVFYYDTDKQLLHFPRNFGKDLKIYHENAYHYIDEEVKLTENHIWNSFDEIGLLMGIERFPLENNENFKERILNVRSHRHGADKIGLSNAIKNLVIGISDRLSDEQKELVSQM